MNAIDFTIVVNMFAMEGMVALGKLKHPATQTLERNLEHAKFTIDVLSVLKEKTATSEERITWTAKAAAPGDDV